MNARRPTIAIALLGAAALPVSSDALARHHHRGRAAVVGWQGRHSRGSGDIAIRVHRKRAHLAAGDPAATIVDFSFSPSTLTVHVGDTVTWTNDGPSPHTATASNGSFDTGTLKKGQSASHTFGQAGTFAYICSIHPFMHGTVVVLASSGSASAGSSGTAASSGSGTSSGSGASSSSPASSSGSSGSSSGASGTSSTPSLPNTGFDSSVALLCGVFLIGGGLLLRRRNSS